MKRIGQIWHGFITQVGPDIDHGSVQYREMRRAFYAGALAMRGVARSFGAVRGAYTDVAIITELQHVDDDITDDEVEAQVDRLMQELAQFYKAIEIGEA